MSIARLIQQAAAGVPTGGGAWDLSYAVWNGPARFSVVTQDSNPTGVFFKPDGTVMYVIGTVVDAVNQYSLSTAWDISTASYVQNFSVASQDGSPLDIFFKSDGTVMYVLGSNGDAVYQYSLSTAWDISTASYVQNFSVAAQETTPTGFFFKSDGTVMYVSGFTGASVYQYSLSTAWDISTASYVQNFSVGAQETYPQGVFFKTDGTVMYVIGSTGDDVNQYSLSTAWDISTIPNTQTFYVGLQETTPQSVFFKPDGTAMYVIGASGDDVNQYSLSTAWDVTTASYIQNFSVAAQDTVPTGIFFKPDGMVMYVIGRSGDNVYQYSLSTAWDISTASYVHLFSVAAQETTPTGFFFKSDGTVMYVIGYDGDAVYQYSLSTAWDISTASYVQNFSVAAQETIPQGIFFKPDGTAMYVIGSNGDAVYQYSLSTAWDVSTASYVQNFYVGLQDSYPSGIFFKPDGTIMYVTGYGGDAVYQYQLG